MSANRFSGLNLVLLAVTLCALLFGVYGFIRPTDHVATAPRNQCKGAAPETASRDDALPEAKPAGLARGPSAGDQPPKGEAAPQPAADGPTAQPAVAAPSDKGDAQLTGLVLSHEGKAVSGAVVTARRSNLNVDVPDVSALQPAEARDALNRYFALLHRETRSTGSDAEGRFRFTGLDPRLAYDLSAQLDGAGRAELRRAAAGDNVRLILKPQALLKGRVTGPDGTAIGEFSVRIYRRNAEWEARERSFSAPDGRFTMECDGGALMVALSAPGFYQSQPAEVSVEGTLTEQVFALEQAATLSGTVRDASGNPLANARISSGGDVRSRSMERRSAGSWEDESSSARTDSLGRYRLDSLAPREYTFTARYGESSETRTITVSAGENTLDFSLDVGATLTLKLRNARGQPVEAEAVYFWRKDGRWLQAERHLAREPGTATFSGIKPGDYTMSVSASGYPSLRRDVKLAAGEQSLELELPDGAMLGGRISSSSGGSIAGLSIRLIKEGEDENMAWGSGRWTQVKADGSFRLGPVEPGLWTIEMLGQDWRKISSEKRSLVVGENSFDFTVNTGGSLTVRITDETGKPAQWAYALLESAQGKRFGANANAQGIADITFIDPGEYVLRVTANRLAAPATTVNIRSGANEAAVSLKTPNCARITAVTPNSQAARIGLAPGDLIIEYAGEKVNNWEDVGRLRRKYESSAEVAMTIERNGQLQSFNLKGGQIGIDGENAVR
ncbi:PDZ domain-containing protein [bacterium]|nr:MAG: PDZ domain-containing protein [bacterium]RIK62893.1 MAG: hypothetical protein DCC64_08685 [Planctomycetota bacterium]